MGRTPGVPNDPLKSAVGAAVVSDPQLKARAGKLAERALAEAEKLMATGSQEVRLALIKSVVPAIVRLADSREEVDQHAELRAQMEEMREAMRSAVFQRSIATTGQAMSNVDNGDDGGGLAGVVVPEDRPLKPLGDGGVALPLRVVNGP